MNNKVNPAVFVIFGGSGDLTWRKLIPALYNLYLDDMLNEQNKILCIGLTKMSNEEYIKHLKEGVDKFSRRGKVKAPQWKKFVEFIDYQTADFLLAPIYKYITKQITDLQKSTKQEVNNVFYFAVPPRFFEPIAEKISEAGLAKYRTQTRIVVEKPFGTDLDSAQKLNAALLKHFEENQIYRIDHYLGKETVQNILALRFANTLFEPIWNRNYIKSVQITVSEQLGVEDRGNYYEGSGALRDMIQNHLMQLFCLIAMEAPVSFNADEVRNKKADVLKAVQPINTEDLSDFAVRGQYGAGWIEGKKVKAYRDEKDVAHDSCTETFAALKLFIDNWRWNGIPFYLRSGKRLNRQTSVISIEFKEVPHLSFPDLAKETWQNNRLILSLQPEMSMKLRLQAKKPGLEMQLNPVEMTFDYHDAYSATGTPEGYETLLLDVMQGDATLFMRADQVEAAWKIVMPILTAWQNNKTISFPNYEAGSFGPENAEALIAKAGDTWFMPPLEQSNNSSAKE